MSGKFMSVKRIIVPTITMIIIASQLMGCAAASQSEMLQMINQGDAIEIEIASPAFAEAEKGEASALLWEQLALLTTNETLRDSWDDILGITVTETGKNGIFYVNEAGENENNNTLRVAIHNREFAKLLEDENSMIELAQAAQSNYADLEVDEIKKSVYMGINGYFNLLPDATPNYCNPDTTLQRNEFMAMVYRAETPVSDLTANETFNTAVGQSDFNIYAQGVLEDSYLDIESKSLDNMTYNGSISRAEAIYLLMSRYFAEDLTSVDISKASFSDAKDGGNIAEEQKFIEDATSKDHWKAYELAYALMNPDNGMPTELYKGLVVAQSKGLISNESRWDESITEAEAVELLVNTLKIETGIQSFNAKQGKVDEYEVEIKTPAEETEETLTVDVTGVDGETDPEVDGTTEATPAPDTDGDSFDDALIDAIIQDVLSGKEPSVSTTPGRSTPEADALLEGKTVYDPNDLPNPNDSDFGKNELPAHLRGDHIQ